MLQTDTARLTSLYIKRGIRCPYVRTYVTYVRNAGRGQLSSEWRHKENDVIMIIDGLWRYGDWRHVATGCNAVVLCALWDINVVRCIKCRRNNDCWSRFYVCKQQNHSGNYCKKYCKKYCEKYCNDFLKNIAIAIAILFRPHRYYVTRPIVTDGVAWSVSRSALVTPTPALFSLSCGPDTQEWCFGLIVYMAGLHLDPLRKHAVINVPSMLLMRRRLKSFPF